MIPIGTDYQMRGRPWANYALVAANVGLFLLGRHGMTRASIMGISTLMLQPDNPQLHQFFTSMFLHAGWAHLIGNMLFLWIFGNAVNDRFGHLGYLAFYLSGGVLAGVGYLLLSGTAPVLGASGAISAVTGAYLVLLPRTRVTVLFFFFYILTPMEISSLFFLLFQLVYNLVMSLSTRVAGQYASGVAYAAHSSGYVFGIAVSAALLATRLLPRDPFDLLNLISASRRRSRYRRMATRGFDPFGFVSPSLRRQSPRKVKARTVESPPADTPAGRQLQLRKDISTACRRGDLTEAASKYLQLVQIADDALLSLPQQLDVANQLMASNQYPAAADAYERFLKHYGKYEHLADIHLMLGLIYGRYLNQFEQAIEHLELAIKGLEDPGKVELAKTDLARLRSHPSR